MNWVAVRRFRSEPIRLATLAILFAATMLAALMLPRQIRAALDATAVSESVAPTAGAGPTKTAWWTPPAARMSTDTSHHRARKARANCRSGCKASDETAQH